MTDGQTTRRLSHKLPGRAWLLLVLLSAGAGWTRAADPVAWNEGMPLAQHFTPRDYQANTDCWCMVQDARGVMYVGNYGLVLEYDGSAWHKIPVGVSGWINCLDYDARTDTVYLGAHNELGCLRAVPGGGRTFVSLLDRLPADARQPGEVRGVHVTPDGVFFVGVSQVMRWRDGQFRVWSFPPGGRLHSGFAAGRLYIQNRELGLQRLEDDRFVPASTDPVFSRAAVCSMVTGAPGEVIVATYQDGLFSLRDGVARPWDIELAGWLKDKHLYQVLGLRDGSLAVVTDSAGLLLLDRDGHFRSHLDGVGGIRNNNVISLYEDAEGGLWAGLHPGVTRLEIDSPLSLLTAGAGEELPTATCSGSWFGQTVLGTVNGLYRLVDADPATATNAHLARLPDSAATFLSAVSVEDGLLLAVPNKVLLLDREGHLVPVFTTPSMGEHLHRSTLNPGQVLVGEDNGQVTALRLDASTHQWTSAGVVAQTGAQGMNYGVAESARGDLWIGSNEHGLFRVRPPAGGGPAVTTVLFDEPGPLHGQSAAWIDTDGGPIIFQTPHQLYRLDESGENVRPASEFGRWANDPSYRFEYVLNYEEGSLWLTASRADVLAGDDLCGQAVAGAPGRLPVFRQLPRKVEQSIGHVQAYFPAEAALAPLSTLLLIGSADNGVVRLDVRRWEAQGTPRPLTTLIRRALTPHGAAAGSPDLSQPLSYARNSLRFEFAAGTLAYGAAPQFQTRLANFGAGDWSDFSERNSVDYLSLPEGSYTFEVRARNADGQLGSVASLPFRVLPPWQRTPWAYAGYTLLAAAAAYALLRWRGRQLQRRNAVLETLVEARTGELRGREAELVRAKDAAESANRAKSAFLANMTHELRTPLNAILGYSQILLRDPDLSARNRERVTTVDRSGHHLLSMINEVLDLSKIEAGKLALLPIDFSLEALLDDLGAAFAPRLAEKGLGFVRVQAPGLPAVVHTDAGKLRQVLFNLLGNALKFTRHGEVRLEVAPAGPGTDRVRFSVADTGIGIAAEELRPIFLAFHQTGEAGGSEMAATPGTGLGLSISQRLVELLGGTLQVESIPGAGSRFWFELALPPVAAAAGGALLAAQAGGLPAGGRVVGYEGAPRRLLVVDDEAINRHVLAELLAPLGFEVEEAAGGAECLQRCAQEPLPDAVLLDLRMSPVGGLEVARTLRARGHQALRLVAVSASVFADDRAQAIEAGCDDFLPKPFREEQLLSVLGRLLALRWVSAEVVVEPVTTDPAAADPARFAREMDALLDLARHGDILGLKARFAALRDAGGIPARHGALARRLEGLLAGYEVDRVHDVLSEFVQHGNN